MNYGKLFHRLEFVNNLIGIPDNLLNEILEKK